jgi:hypothetical protein
MMVGGERPETERERERERERESARGGIGRRDAVPEEKAGPGFQASHAMTQPSDREEYQTYPIHD